MRPLTLKTLHVRYRTVTQRKRRNVTAKEMNP
jgi:hypothetical protein